MRAITSSKAGDVQGAMAGSTAPGESTATQQQQPSQQTGDDFAGLLDAKQPGKGIDYQTQANQQPSKPATQQENPQPAVSSAAVTTTAVSTTVPRKPGAPEKKPAAKESSSSTKQDPAQQAALLAAGAAQVQPIVQMLQQQQQQPQNGEAELGAVENGASASSAATDVQGPAADLGIQAQMASIATQNIAGALTAANLTQPAAAANLTAATAAVAAQTAAATPGLSANAKPETPTGSDPAPVTRGKGIPAWMAARAAKSGAAEIAGSHPVSETGENAALGTASDKQGGKADNQPLVGDGTAGALQSGNMALQAPMQQSKSAFAVSGALRASTDANTAVTASSSTTLSARVLPTLRPAASSPAPVQQPAVNPLYTLSNNAGTAGSIDKVTGTSAIHAAAQQELTTATLNRVMDAAATMRTMGENRVELQMKLDDGQQITVRLQMTDGAVHPVFKTESGELRQALEQNWAGFRSEASQKGLDIAAPVFESPNSQSGFGSYSGGSGQQAGQNSGQAQETDEVFNLPGQTSSRQTINPTLAAAAANPAAVSGGVQMYA